MKRFLIAAVLGLVILAGTAGAMMNAPVPLDDMYECMRNPALRAGPFDGTCPEFFQILSDVGWAYYLGRPVVIGPDAPFLETWAILSCFDTPGFIPPAFDLECMGPVVAAMWSSLNS